MRSCGCFVAVMLTSVVASAATISVSPLADTFVSSANPTSNYGGAGALAVSGTGTAKAEFQTLLRFNTLAAKNSFDSTFAGSDWHIQSATLVLTSASANNALFNANAAGTLRIDWMSNDGWTEGTGGPSSPTTDGLTYSMLPALLSGSDALLGSFSYNGSSSGAKLFTLNNASSFVSDITGGNDVTLRVYAGDSTVSSVSNSRNFPTASAQPVLMLTAVPEPHAALLVMALSALSLRRRIR